MSAAAEIATELEARTHPPAEVGGGRLLSIWPSDEVPTFVSITGQADLCRDGFGFGSLRRASP